MPVIAIWENSKDEKIYTSKFDIITAECAEVFMFLAINFSYVYNLEEIYEVSLNYWPVQA